MPLSIRSDASSMINKFSPEAMLKAGGKCRAGAEGIWDKGNERDQEEQVPEENERITGDRGEGRSVTLQTKDRKRKWQRAGR